MEPPIRRKVVAAALALLLGVTGVWLAASRSSALSEVERLQKKLEISRGDAGVEIEALEAEISELSRELNVLRTEAATLSADLEAAEIEREQISEELALAIERNTALEATLAVIGDLEIALMPDLSGSGLELARAFAEDNGATLIFEMVAPGNLIARPGAIIEQLPIAGTPVIPGTVIWVQVFSP
jgi:HAMP domain-containing protein